MKIHHVVHHEHLAYVLRTRKVLGIDDSSFRVERKPK